MVEPIDSSKLTSAQMKQQLKEQTRGLKEAPGEESIQMPTEIFEAAEEAPGEIETQTTETQEEQTEETRGEEEIQAENVETEKTTGSEKATLHKIKVEGKEEDLPYEKLIEYAQKGRHYEKEMGKLKKEREQLRAEGPARQPQSPSNQETFTPEQANEQFLNEFARNPIGALAQVQQFMFQQRDNQSAAEKKADLEFDQDQTESNPVWKDIKPRFREYRELGYTREMAAMAAENDFLKTAIVNARTAGRTDGEKKEKAKQKAQMPSEGNKGQKRAEAGISDEALGRMSSKSLKSKIPRISTPGF